jgi:hypothetical protein
MNLQRWTTPLAGALALVTILACGGGGGGGGGSNGSTSGNVTNLRALAVLGGDNRIVAPLTVIQRGDPVRFVIAGTSESTGNLVIVPSGDWGVSPASIGAITPATGAFTATQTGIDAIATGVTTDSQSKGTRFNVIEPQAVGTGLQMAASVSGTIVDPENIQVGDVVALTLAGVGLNGEVVQASVSSWSTTAPGSVATLSGSTLTATGPSGTSIYELRANALGRAHTAILRIKPVQALVFGRVRTTGGALVAGARVRFFNAGGSEVGRVRSNPDGTFRASVPTTAVTFHLDVDEIDPSATVYFRQFAYGPKDYSIAIDTCRAPLPALTNGVSTALPNDILLYRQGPGVLPPPPPDGC